MPKLIQLRILELARIQWSQVREDRYLPDRASRLPMAAYLLILMITFSHLSKSTVSQWTSIKSFATGVLYQEDSLSVVVQANLIQTRDYSQWVVPSTHFSHAAALAKTWKEIVLTTHTSFKKKITPSNFTTTIFVQGQKTTRPMISSKKVSRCMMTLFQKKTVRPMPTCEKSPTTRNCLPNQSDHFLQLDNSQGYPTWELQRPRLMKRRDQKSMSSAIKLRIVLRKMKIFLPVTNLSRN